ncbi:MAG: sulfotransferase [Flavobacteriales bacterium]|nr:sulfotransferase [Flavobacteriales bacterium]
MESVLLELNHLINNIQPNNVQSLPSSPILLIMGCPRSGTTLFLQWLAALGVFSYPSNLIARFYSNPYVGIKVQQALLELDPINQLGFVQSKFDFSSNLGKTIGALNPSEYWYFWREYFKFQSTNFLTEDDLNKINVEELLKKLNAFESITSKPLVMKGLLLNWHIPFLHNCYDKFIFVDLKRDYLYNSQSILKAREKYFNSKEKWYSLRPKEYSELKDKSPLEQVAGQVIYTRKAIEDGLSNIPKKNRLTIDYSELCSSPKIILDRIVNKYNEFGVNINVDNIDPSLFKSFKISNNIELNKKDISLLNEYLNKYENLI